MESFIIACLTRNVKFSPHFAALRDWVPICQLGLHTSTNAKDLMESGILSDAVSTLCREIVQSGVIGSKVRQ